MTKVAGKLSSLANGVVSTIQVSALRNDFHAGAPTNLQFAMKFMNPVFVALLRWRFVTPYLRMYDWFNRHRFQSLKLSTLIIADMALYGWLNFRNRLPEWFLNFDELKLASFTRYYMDTNLKYQFSAFCGESNPEVAKKIFTS